MSDDEPSQVEAWTRAGASKAREHPYRAMGASAAVAVALAQGIPYAVDSFVEYSAAGDERVDALHEAHVESLTTELERCNESRTRLIERVRELADECRGIAP